MTYDVLVCVENERLCRLIPVLREDVDDEGFTSHLQASQRHKDMNHQKSGNSRVLPGHQACS